MSTGIIDVLIIGAGVGGLNCARELKHADPSLSVRILEARQKVGGRSLTLRSGDVLEEAPLGKPKTQQTVTFKRPTGDSEPYWNAGPGRFPSAHVNLLQVLKVLRVPLEVYIMNTESNLVHVGSNPTEVYRRINHNSRGFKCLPCQDGKKVRLFPLNPLQSAL